MVQLTTKPKPVILGGFGQRLEPSRRPRIMGFFLVRTEAAVKAGTHELIKFKKLQRLLNLQLWQAIGLLEALWQLTAKNAPRGDIGRFTNDEIAAWLEYHGDENELISALIESGWVDECSSARLVTHDWHDHAPNYVKGNVIRHLGGFVTVTNGALRDTPDTEIDGSPGDSPHGTVPPNLTKSNQAKSNHIDPVFDQFWQAYPMRNGRRVGKQKAVAQWAKISPEKHQEILDATNNYSSECNGFPKDAERYLRDKVWLDYLAPKPTGPRALTEEELKSWTPE